MKSPMSEAQGERYTVASRLCGARSTLLAGLLVACSTEPQPGAHQPPDPDQDELHAGTQPKGPAPTERPRGRRRGQQTTSSLDPYLDHTAPVDRQELLQLYAQTWHPDFSGQLILHLSPGHYILEDDSESSSDGRKRAFHLSAYDRERRIPLLVHVPGDPAPAARDEPTSLESIGATLFDLLQVPRPPHVTAQALHVATTTKPKVVVVLVLDGLPYAHWEAYLGEQPGFAALRAASQEYTQTRLDFMSSSTTVSHAVLATGAPPRFTGIPINHTRTSPGHYGEVFEGDDPERLLVPTVADLYDLQHDNEPVIISFCSQSRAAIAMAGHGSSWPGGDKDVVVWQQRYWGPLETNSAYYALLSYLRPLDPDLYLDELQDRRFVNHRIDSEAALFRSHHNIIIGERVVSTLMEREGAGQDEVTDLVFFNQKVLDNIGHRWGVDGREVELCLDELDAFITRFVAELHRVAGDDFVLFVTSDHGFGPRLRRPDEGGTPARHLRAELQAELEQRFGAPGRPVLEDIQYLNVYLDRDNLQANGHSLADLCSAFEERPWIQACLTQDEVIAVRDAP